MKCLQALQVLLLSLGEIWSRAVAHFFNLPVSQRRELHTAGYLVPYDKSSAPAQSCCDFITINDCVNGTLTRQWTFIQAIAWSSVESIGLIACNVCVQGWAIVRAQGEWCAGKQPDFSSTKQPTQIQQLQSPQDMPVLSWSKGARGERPETPPKRQLGAPISTSKTVSASALRHHQRFHNWLRPGRCRTGLETSANWKAAVINSTPTPFLGWLQ